jgi:hypothetical protein
LSALALFKSQACQLLFHTNTTKQTTGAFRAFLARATGCNQREFVGIIKSVMKMRPSRQTSNHTAVVLDAMKFIARTGVHKKFPEEFNVAKDTFDLALTCQYASMKAVDTPLEKFVDIYREILGLLMDSEKLEEVMQAMATKQFDDIGESVSALVHSSTIGQRLFQVAWESCAADSMHKLFQKTLAQLNSRPLTVQIVGEVKNACLKEAPTVISCASFLHSQAEARSA